MPCFHFRGGLREDDEPISQTMGMRPDRSSKSVAPRMGMRQKSWGPFDQTTSVSSFASSGEGSLLPPENLAATKRRLVVIRRQASFAPIVLSVGFKSRTGWQALRASRHNQDSMVVLLALPDPIPDYSLFAVFDGHGRAAHRVSAFVAQSLAKHFASMLASERMSLAKALRRSCHRATQDLLSNASLDVSMTGTTTAVMAIHGRTLMCANIGDSRIVLATTRKDKLVPLALTTDHLPMDESERQRVEEAGGRIDSWTPAGLDTGPPRVWLKERRLPGLAITRVIGDSILDGIAIAQPELTTHQLVNEDRFAVVATDGIWSVMSNMEVVQFVAERELLPVQLVGEMLVRHAAERWFEDGGESIDDITAIIVRFKR